MSLRSTGASLFTNTVPSPTGDFSLVGWFNVRAGTNGVPTHNQLAFDDPAGANPGIYVARGDGSTSWEAYTWNGTTVTAQQTLATAPTPYVHLCVTHAAGSSNYGLLWRALGTETYTTATLAAGAQMSSLARLWLASDDGGETEMDALFRAFGTFAAVLTAAQCMALSQTAGGIAGAMHFLPLNNAAIPGLNLVGTNWTPAGTWLADFNEPNFPNPRKPPPRLPPGPPRLQRQTPPFWPPSLIALATTTAPAASTVGPAGGSTGERSGAVQLVTNPTAVYGVDAPPAPVPGQFNRFVPPFWPPSFVRLSTVNPPATSSVAPAGTAPGARSGAPALVVTLAPAGTSSAQRSGTCAALPVLLAAGCRSAERRGAPAGVPTLALAGGSPGQRAGTCVALPALVGVGCRSSERSGAGQTVASLATTGARPSERSGPEALIPSVVLFPSGPRSGERAGPSTFGGIALSPAGVRSGEHAGATNTSTILLVQPAGARSGERSGSSSFVGIALQPTGARGGAASGASSSGAQVGSAGARTGARSGATPVGPALVPVGSNAREAHGAPALPLSLLPSSARSQQRAGAVVAFPTIVVFPAGARSGEHATSPTFAVVLAPTGARAPTRDGANLLVPVMASAGAKASSASGPVLVTLIIRVQPTGARSGEHFGFWGVTVNSVYIPAADETDRFKLRYHPRKFKLMSIEGLFAAGELQRGKRTDFDFDARGWLTGTGLLASFTLVQAAGDPVTYEAPTIYGGKDVKVFASVPADATPGYYRVAVELVDDQGRTARQYFQMRVL